MFKCINSALAGLVIVMSSAGVYADAYPNVGRTATEQEIASWDIDVRPDFKGLPAGSGSVARGQEIWEGRCASCHGTFGESNEVFTPLIGGTTSEDIKSGRVAALASNKQPQKTTIMKVATLSTLWDYIHRAMPWTAPKSLSNDDVFAVVAYLLSLAEIVPENFTLTDQNIAEIQKRMPNRNGMTQEHGLWDVKGKPDVRSIACMRGCDVQPQIRSSLPDAARNAHGNLRQQNRTFGPVRGIDTSATVGNSANGNKPGTGAPNNAEPEPLIKSAATDTDMRGLAKQNNCLACHGLQNRIVGPGFNEIANRYKAEPAVVARLVEKVRNGGSGSWGSSAMPAQRHVGEEEIKSLIKWILAGAK